MQLPTSIKHAVPAAWLPARHPLNQHGRDLYNLDQLLAFAQVFATVCSDIPLPMDMPVKKRRAVARRLAYLQQIGYSNDFIAAEIAALDWVLYNTTAVAHNVGQDQGATS